MEKFTERDGREIFSTEHDFTPEEHLRNAEMQQMENVHYGNLIVKGHTPKEAQVMAHEMAEAEMKQREKEKEEAGGNVIPFRAPKQNAPEKPGGEERRAA